LTKAGARFASCRVVRVPGLRVPPPKLGAPCEFLHRNWAPHASSSLKLGAPCMTASSPVKAKRRAISRGGRGDVKGAVLWRSSRSLTSPRPLQQLILEQSSDVLSELCSILEKISFIGETTQTRMLIFNHLRWFPEVPSTMYSARNCTMISCSNSLLLAREAGCPIRSSAFCRNH